MDTKALYSLSYGLFVLTARENDRDNGCIINTAMQVTSQPNRISITVNKANHTHDMIHRTGVFNLSVLGERTPFSVFERFGFSSGRDVDKFAGDDVSPRSENGVRYLGEYANALLSGRVFAEVDCGTHTLFLADLTDAAVLSDAPSMTYAYYFANVKPKPQPKPEEKTGWVCKICGYVYEGEELPADFVCPLCKHGAEDFERIGGAKAEPTAPAAATEPESKGRYVCQICGYVYEGEELPADFVCPICQRKAEDFAREN
jgi:flavin reductase (DIM6/NTAB) family NADH-FMN oxidoreductase RutF